eukprot:SAG11_NODE_217_length_12229_cov_9.152185_1_plen_100_part_00
MAQSVGCWDANLLLGRKNLTLKKRQYLAWGCGCCPCCAAIWELVLPFGLILLFAYLKGMSDPATIPAGWSSSNDDGASVAGAEASATHRQIAYATGRVP